MIPLRYNVRNLFVRWKTTLMTAIGFTLVVALLVVMLAFVKGLNKLSENTGPPGNVIILRDGANDEIFSDIALDDKIYELWSNHAEIVKDEETKQPMASQEVYSILTQELPPEKAGDRPKYRFLQIRGVENPQMAGKVHNLPIKEGRWFSRQGNEMVAGEGIARNLGLKIGDTFRPKPQIEWKVVGIMDSAGSPFNSEIWAKREEVGRNFGKDSQGKDGSEGKSFYTSIVVTTPDQATAEQFARDLQSRTQVKINAMPERRYYENLSQSTQVFFITALIIAILMAVGGTFGLLNTMFAAVSQRIKDIGVLRVLGYGRGQILLSFLLESLLIALIGGALGVMIGYLVNGVEQTGQMSSGQGGGKTVVFKMVVDYSVVMWGLAFTLGMGLLGGLLPAWSAMRLKVLDALR